MSKYTLGTKISEDPCNGSKWIVKQDGVHQQYYPLLTISTGGTHELEEKMAKLAVEAWTKADI